MKSKAFFAAVFLEQGVSVELCGCLVLSSMGQGAAAGAGAAAAAAPERPWAVGLFLGGQLPAAAQSV